MQTALCGTLALHSVRISKFHRCSSFSSTLKRAPQFLWTFRLPSRQQNFHSSSAARERKHGVNSILCLHSKAICSCRRTCTPNPKPHCRFISNSTVGPGSGSGSDSDLSVAWKLDKKVYDKGPDQILPSEARTAWHPDGAVKISFGNTPTSQLKPKSVPAFVKEAVDEAPNQLALRIKRNDKWFTWTYQQYYDDILTTAKAFIALGLERHHAVCILGQGNPEWFLSSMAAIFSGGLSTGLYPTNTTRAAEFCSSHCKANIFVVEDKEQLEKVLVFRDNLTHLKVIVLIHEDPSIPKIPGLITWKQLMKLGKESSDSILEERMRLLAINQCCALVYTSGTTGEPKGVMLSHDNLTFTTEAMENHFALPPCEHRFISFLPLSHVAAQVADMYCALRLRASVTFGDKEALKGSIINTMKEVQPTCYFAVPRLYEKIYEKMHEGRKTMGPVKGFLLDVAKSRGFKYNVQRMNKVESPKVWGYSFFDRLLFSKVKKELGLTQAQLIFSGAASLDIEVLNAFLSLNIPILELFGLSETTGPAIINTPKDFRLGSIGLPLLGTELSILNPNESGHGEISMRGRHIMMGYLNNPEKTRKTFSNDNFFMSGDIGYVDPDGYVFITGRQKDIIITAGGENVAPTEIEGRVKANLSIVNHAVIVGDRRKYLTLLLTLKTEVDEDNEPTDQLTEYVRTWVSSRGGITAKTLSDVRSAIQRPDGQKLRQAIQTKIDAVNKTSASRAQEIRAWSILPHDFSISGCEIGPTLKLKRHAVYNKYKNEIDSMYKSENEPNE